MQNTPYQTLKRLPLIGSLMEKARTSLHHWVVRVIHENVPPTAPMQPIADNHAPLLAQQQALEQRCQQLEQQQQSLAQQQHVLEQQQRNSTQQEQILGERIEYVRLELFYELMHRLQHAAGSTPIDSGEPRILNQAAFLAAQTKGKLRLNLGCGHHPLPDYLNVDQRALPQVDIQADALKLPVAAGTVDTLRAAHLIEHFTLADLRRRVLPYWRECLSTGGTLHLIAPNAQASIDAYAAQQIPFGQLTTVLLGMQEYAGDFHFALLNPESLRKLLEESGFTDIAFNATGRANGLCLEMDVTARKPAVT
jgi:predicted SAM-dependent methyltransferase